QVASRKTSQDGAEPPRRPTALPFLSPATEEPVAADIEGQPRYFLRSASPRVEAFLLQRAVADGRVTTNRGAAREVGEAQDQEAGTSDGGSVTSPPGQEAVSEEESEEMDGMNLMLKAPKFESRVLGSFAQFEDEFIDYLAHLKGWARVHNKKALLVALFESMSHGVCKSREDPFSTWSKEEHPAILMEHKAEWVRAGYREADHDGMEFTGSNGRQVPDLWRFYLSKVKAKFDIGDPDAKRRVQQFKQAESETPAQAAARFDDLVRCVKRGAISDDDLASHFFDGLKDDNMRAFIQFVFTQQEVGSRDWTLKFVQEKAQQYYVTRSLSNRGVSAPMVPEMPRKLRGTSLSTTADTSPASELEELLQAWRSGKISLTTKSADTLVRPANQPDGKVARRPVTNTGERRERVGKRQETNCSTPAAGRPCTYPRCLGRRAAHPESECWTKQLDEGKVNAQAPPPPYFMEKHKTARAAEHKSLMTHVDFPEDLGTTLAITKAELCEYQWRQQEEMKPAVSPLVDSQPATRHVGGSMSAESNRACASREALPLGFNQLPPTPLPSTVSRTTTNTTMLECQWGDGRRVQLQLSPHAPLEALKELLQLAQSVIGNSGHNGGAPSTTDRTITMSNISTKTTE
ncbi:hypothetical protein Vafri_15999, partial [Volvox africanus]